MSGSGQLSDIFQSEGRKKKKEGEEDGGRARK